MPLDCNPCFLTEPRGDNDGAIMMTFEETISFPVIWSLFDPIIVAAGDGVMEGLDVFEVEPECLFGPK